MTERHHVKIFHIPCGTNVSKLKEGYFCPECATYTIDENLAVAFTEVKKYLQCDLEETYQDNE
jgi:hypothetical protein